MFYFVNQSLQFSKGQIIYIYITTYCKSSSQWRKIMLLYYEQSCIENHETFDYVKHAQ